LRSSETMLCLGGQEGLPRSRHRYAGGQGSPQEIQCLLAADSELSPANRSGRYANLCRALSSQPTRFLKSWATRLARLLSIPERRKANAYSDRGNLRVGQRGGERNAGLPANHCASMSPVIFCDTKSICFRQAAGRARKGSFNFFRARSTQSGITCGDKSSTKLQKNIRKSGIGDWHT
jgi:hypothetical protein